MDSFVILMAIFSCIWAVIAIAFTVYLYIMEVRVMKKLNEILDENQE